MTQAIMGGSAALDAGAPGDIEDSIVAIESMNGNLLCTGTVVATGRVLTAAHCRRDEPLRLRIPATGGDVAVQRAIVHPSLDIMVIDFDAGAAGFGSVLVLSRVETGIGWVGRRVALAGYGRTEAGSTGDLRFVEETVTRESAAELAVDGAGASGACEGDSGGPLLVFDGGGARVEGVLSRGSASCRGIDVYTRTEPVAAWLDAVEACPER
jgi:hypothetical protein